jgi:hypothetical protein
MAKKRKAAASKRASRRRTARRRRGNADTTVNTLVILVVIVIVLGGLYLYAQNKKQAAFLQSLSPAIAAIMTPIKTALASRTAAVAPSALPTTSSPSIPAPEPAAGSDGRQPVALTEVK